MRGKPERAFKIRYTLLEKTIALMDAAKDGNSERVEKLLQLGTDINTKGEYGETAVMKAAKNGHSKCVEVLEALLAKIAKKSHQHNDTFPYINIMPLYQLLIMVYGVIGILNQHNGT